MKFLDEEGFKHEENDNLISFKFKGKTYVAFRNEGKPFLSLSMIYDIQDVPREQLLELCNKMNEGHFVTKYTLDNDSEGIWVSYEFEPNEETTNQEFMRILNLLPRNVAEFFNTLNGDDDNE